MEFACSHVVCNWNPDAAAPVICPALPGLFQGGESSQGVTSRPLSFCDHDYDNRVAVISKSESLLVAPPLPPRESSLKKHFTRPRSMPPPLPPRGLEAKGETRLKANVNVISLSVGRLVDIHKATGVQCNRIPVYCDQCCAAMSTLSTLRHKQNVTVWCCEFCGMKNTLPSTESGSMLSLHRQPLPGRDVLYLPKGDEGDYINLEDMLVVFCVDISGSMSVTTEVMAGNIMRSPTYVSRLQSVQDALLRALSTLLQTSPRRRVALVTFNDEVTVYGDGTGVPLTLRDCSLMDFDFLKDQGNKFSNPHCIAESIQALTQKVKEMREYGATALGPAALISIAMASRYPGSKVIICTDGQANIGLGELEQGSALTIYSPYFYKQLAKEAVDRGVIVSVLTFEGTDCRLAELGKLADHTGGRVNIVNISNVSSEIQSVLADRVLATDVTATLLSAEGVYFPYEDQSAHKLVRKLGNVTEGVEITFQFAVKPESVESFQRRDRVPFQVQLDFKTRDLQKVTRVVTEQRRVTTSSWVWVGSLNMAVLGVHCVQLCARLTMEGRFLEAQKQLKAQQDLIKDISEQRPGPKEESVYGNWISTMSTICEDLSAGSQMKIETKDLQATQSSPIQGLSDEAAKVVYQLKRAKTVKPRKKAPPEPLGL